MEDKSIGKTTARNSIYSIIANSWYLLSRFLLTPFILHFLNLKEYGLWTLCFVVISFLALTSIGLEGTYIKYVAEFHARGEKERINRLLSTGLLLTSVVAVCILTVMWLAMPQIISVLKIEPDLHQKAAFVFMGTGVIFMLDISLSCFGRTLDGLQQMALTAKIRLFSSFIELALIVVFLLGGLGVYGMMTAFLIRYVLTIACNARFAFKFMPELKISYRYFDKPSLKLLISYGGRMQVLGFIGIFMSTFDKIIVTRVLGLAYTGMYEIGRKIPATAARLPAEVSGAMMPALSYLQGKNDIGHARSLFISASRYIAMLSAPLFTYLFVAAPYAIYVWLGTGYEDATAVMYIFSAGILVNLLTGASSAAAKGFNRLEWELRYGVANFVLCLVMTPVLAHYAGLAGAAAGVALSTAIASIYFIGVTNRFFRITIKEYVTTVLSPVMASILSAAMVFYLLRQWITVDSTDRLVAVPILLGAGVLHILACFLLLWVSGGIQSSEKQWLLDRLPKAIKQTHSS